MFVVYYNTGKAVLGQCCTCRRGGVEVVIEDVKRERELITRNWRVTFVPIDFLLVPFIGNLILSCFFHISLPSEVPALRDQVLGWWIRALILRRSFNVCTDQHSPSLICLYHQYCLKVTLKA